MGFNAQECERDSEENRMKCAVGIQIPPYIRWYPAHLPSDAKYNDRSAKSCLRCGAWIERENA